MPDYKNVRLEIQVYGEIERRMRPRESFSQTIERLLANLDEVTGWAHKVIQITEADVSKRVQQIQETPRG